LWPEISHHINIICLPYYQSSTADAMPFGKPLCNAFLTVSPTFCPPESPPLPSKPLLLSSVVALSACKQYSTAARWNPGHAPYAVGGAAKFALKLIQALLFAAPTLAL
jgi:hypothetical protein